jgi:hypothetical protein
MKNHEEDEVIAELEESLVKLRIKEQPLNKFHLLDNVQSRLNTIPRVRRCSTIPIKNTSVITIGHSKKTGGFIYGTNKCGNKCCIVCSNQATAKQTELVQEILNKAFRYELPVFFSTFTIERMNNIDAQWKLIADITKEFKRRLKKALRSEFGSDFAYIFNKDFTFSKDMRKGIYHTHLHCLFILDKPLKLRKFALQNELNTKDPVKVFKALTKRLWTETARHFKARSEEVAQDIQEVKKTEDTEVISDYVVKISKNNEKISYEVSRNTTKQSKQGSSFGLFEMLQRIYQSDIKDKSLIRTYKEFTKFVSGKQFFSTSRKIKDWIEDKKPLRSELEKEYKTEEEQEEVVVEKIEVDMSVSLFKILTFFKLRGQLFEILESHWRDQNNLLRSKLYEISEFSISIKDYNTFIQQSKMLNKHLIEFIQILKIDDLISDSHYHRCLRTLKK